MLDYKRHDHERNIYRWLHCPFSPDKLLRTIWRHSIRAFPLTERDRTHTSSNHKDWPSFSPRALFFVAMSIQEGTVSSPRHIPLLTSILRERWQPPETSVWYIRSGLQKDFRDFGEFHGVCLCNRALSTSRKQWGPQTWARDGQRRASKKRSAWTCTERCCSLSSAGWEGRRHFCLWTLPTNRKTSCDREWGTDSLVCGFGLSQVINSAFLHLCL